MAPVRTDRGRTPLSRERILRTAAALADADGLDALTMRSLAADLHVEAMSLYNHVDSKDDLLDGMVELVADEVTEPPEGTHWRTALRERATALHQALVHHPWASMLWASRMTVGPARLRLMDGMLRDLRHAGFPPGLLDLAFHTLHNHVVGHALQDASFPFDAEDLPALSARYLEDFPTEEYPDLAAHIRYHLDVHDGEGTAFAYGLESILDALGRDLLRSQA